MRFFKVAGFVLTILGDRRHGRSNLFLDRLSHVGSLPDHGSGGTIYLLQERIEGKEGTMRRFTIMTMVRLDEKNRTVKVVGTKTLPYKRKEPAPAGPDQNK